MDNLSNTLNRCSIQPSRTGQICDGGHRFSEDRLGTAIGQRWHRYHRLRGRLQGGQKRKLDIGDRLHCKAILQGAKTLGGKVETFWKGFVNVEILLADTEASQTSHLPVPRDG